MTRVFVYGSLLEGELNDHIMEGACLIGAATTSPGFTLLDLGDYPAMAASSEGCVMGEVYEVSRAHLARLDRFEGHPRFYTRAKIQLADGTLAETYLMPPGRVEQRKPISSGDWRSYRKERGP
jgi:gamma-glutamylcyclotransferase (GGCT)/AIG2-like uncharacterized protein YtfP